MAAERMIQAGKLRRKAETLARRCVNNGMSRTAVAKVPGLTTVPALSATLIPFLRDFYPENSTTVKKDEIGIVTSAVNRAITICLIPSAWGEGYCASPRSGGRCCTRRCCPATI